MNDGGITPLPWRLREISGSQPGSGAILERGTTQSVQIVPLPDARYVVKACNAFPELVDTLREMVLDCEHNAGKVRNDTKRKADQLLDRLETAR